MTTGRAVSRRRFVGSVALGSAGLSSIDLWAQVRASDAPPPAVDGYDALVKLSANENNWGPSPAVMTAMTKAFAYANRYSYPDGDVVKAIAAHHGVAADHILLGAGSGELLDAAGSALLSGGKKVLGAEPTFGAVYQHATALRSEGITRPLTKDYQQDIDALLEAAQQHANELGFVYLCNPNNPTGVIVPSKDVRRLLDGLPAGLPVLIDEAYFHYVDHAQYATAVPYVQDGRPVIVTRTFSKIAALAGVRLGYAIAAPATITRMKAYTTGGVSALAKWGGVAALSDTAHAATIKRETIALRQKTIAAVAARGYQSIPSETNFFMVHIKREVGPVIEAFRKLNVAVGRPFPPMTQHLRVSVGTEKDMDAFVAAFTKVMA